MTTAERRPLTPLQRSLIDIGQRGLPLVSQPYLALAEQLGVSEAEVLEALKEIKALGVLDRVGGVLASNRVTASTLAALAVPPERLNQVAALVSAFTEVNHNYEREHHYNLWFVAVAASQTRLAEVLDEIERQSGLPVLRLPQLAAYRIDLGFPVQWT
ncbi:Siroheme decarboxylase NirD subunit [uncultured Gammaproteobacteria bacterium]